MKAIKSLSFGIICLAWFCSSCLDLDDSSSEPDRQVQGPSLDRPQDLHFIDDELLVVTNSGFGSDAWRDGYLSVIHQQTGEMLNDLATSQFNPVHLSLYKEKLYVVNSGRLDLTNFDEPKSLDPGAIDIFEVDDLKAGIGPVMTWQVPTVDGYESESAPSQLVWHSDVALLTSSLFNRVWIIDKVPDGPAPIFQEVALEENLSLGLGSAVAWDEYFVVLDFNSDLGYLVSTGARLHPCALELGDSSDMEGASVPLVEGQTLYYLLALSGVVKALDLVKWRDECIRDGQTILAPLGQVPNDLALWDDNLAVLHSGDNNVVLYERENGNEVSRLLLSVGSNPYQFALSSTGDAMGVSEWLSDQVTVFERGGRVRFQAP